MARHSSKGFFNISQLFQASAFHLLDSFQFFNVFRQNKTFKGGTGSGIQYKKIDTRKFNEKNTTHCHLPKNQHLKNTQTQNAQHLWQLLFNLVNK